jgi:hypothetical protein
MIDYESEQDAMPIEHEQEHRQLVEKLLGSKVRDIAVERVGSHVNIQVQEEPEAEPGARLT